MNTVKFPEKVISEDTNFERFLGVQESQHIQPATDFIEDLRERLKHGHQETGDPLPWVEDHDTIRFRSGETTLWAGMGGSFKSMLTGMLALWFTRNRKVLIASLEMAVVETLYRMAMQASKGNLDDPTVIDRFSDRVRDQLWMYNQTDIVKAERLLGMMHFAGGELGIQHLFFDSIVMAGLGSEYDDQRKFFSRIVYCAKKYKMHIHVIHHVRKGRDTHDIPSGFDVKGAGELRDLTSNLIIVHPNKDKIERKTDGHRVSDEEPDLRLIVDKQRNGAFEGVLGLFTHAQSMQFIKRPYKTHLLDLI